MDERRSKRSNRDISGSRVNREGSRVSREGSRVNREGSRVNRRDEDNRDRVTDREHGGEERIERTRDEDTKVRVVERERSRSLGESSLGESNQARIRVTERECGGEERVERIESTDSIPAFERESGQGNMLSNSHGSPRIAPPPANLARLSGQRHEREQSYRPNAMQRTSYVDEMENAYTIDMENAYTVDNNPAHIAGLGTFLHSQHRKKNPEKGSRKHKELISRCLNQSSEERAVAFGKLDLFYATDNTDREFHVNLSTLQRINLHILQQEVLSAIAEMANDGLTGSRDGLTNSGDGIRVALQNYGMSM